MTFLINQIVLSGFNLVNAFVDAYKIKWLHKEIRHRINLTAYAICVGILIWRQGMHLDAATNFCFSAFFQRQLTFDIPLNLRRGLKWYYQSTANPPKAFWDRVERWFFRDHSGKEIAIFYLGMYLITVYIQLSFL